MTHALLDAALSLRHAVQVGDVDEAAALAAEADADDTDHLHGYISERGRVLTWKSAGGRYLLYEGAIQTRDHDEWAPIGVPRIYRFDTTTKAEMHADALRLFLSQSLRNGGARRSTGWRDRIVALVPEEVGPKESKIIRTLASGGIEATHTYNVLDAYAKYAEWVNELADEFGGTDAKLEARIETPDFAPFPAIAPTIIQAWLMREASEAALDQARASLKFGLAGLTRLQQLSNGVSGASVAELARSLHTDRPNLTRAIKAAERDARIAEILASLPH
jgi:hypothetical protein